VDVLPVSAHDEEEADMRFRRRALPLREYWKAAGIPAPADLSAEDAADGALADAVITALAAGDRQPLEGVADLLERQLAAADVDGLRPLVNLIETLQNATSWTGLGGAAAVVPLLGPYAAHAWEVVDERWARVSAAVPPQEQDFDLVVDRRLRWILISSHRQVAPGLYTSVADVLRYEKGTDG
jgi:hypothetical protein